jgi:hypothetical protein
MKTLTVKPVPEKYKHPDPPNEALMRHEFTIGLIAPKGAGKTTLICNLLNFYKGYFHNIVIFSPTMESDEKFVWLKAQKLLGRNTALEKFIRNLKRKKDNESLVERPDDEDEFEGLVPSKDEFDGIIPENCYYNEYNDDAFKALMDEQKHVIKLLEKHGQPKYLANRLLVVFDDLVGSSLFSGSRGSYFKGINTRHRHFSASFIMVSQGYKEIPKTIRTNWTGLITFEIGNEREIMVIFEEYTMGLNWNQWKELYDHAVEEDHSFLYINYQRPRRLRIMKNFDTVLFVE